MPVTISQRTEVYDPQHQTKYYQIQVYREREEKKKTLKNKTKIIIIMTSDPLKYDILSSFSATWKCFL
jgi:hypothetical protein